MARQPRQVCVRVRLHDDPATQLARIIKGVVDRATRKRICKRPPKITFAITTEGIEVTAQYLCYRSIEYATFEDLGAYGWGILNHTVDTAYRQLQSDLMSPKKQ